MHAKIKLSRPTNKLGTKNKQSTKFSPTRKSPMKSLYCRGVHEVK